jgi:hypothetical protein
MAEGREPDWNAMITTGGRQRLAWTVVLALVLALVGWWAVDLYSTGKAIDEAKTVRVLPAGVEEAWSGYADRQLDRMVQPRGDMVKVTSIGGTREFVSRSTPARVMCVGKTPMLFFGRGEDSTMAMLYEDHPQASNEERPPPLGVHPDSVAARGLWGRLCDRVSDRLQAIMTDPEPRPVPPVLTEQKSETAASDFEPYVPAPPPGPPTP